MGQPGLAEQIVGGLEIIQISRAAQRRHQITHRIDGLLAAANAGELADGLGIGRRGRSGIDHLPFHRAPHGRVAQTVEGHEVGIVIGIQHRRLPRLGRARALKQRPQHPHRGHGQHEGGGAGQAQGLGEQRDDLGVGGRPHFPNALHTALGKLAGLHLVVGLGLAEDALGVAEAQRARFASQSRGAHARNLQRDVRAHGQKVVMGIEELEGRGGHAATGAHDVHHLQGGRLDRRVAAGGEQVGHRPGDGLAYARLLGEHVAKARWCHSIQRESSLAFGNRDCHVTRLLPSRRPKTAKGELSTEFTALPVL